MPRILAVALIAAGTLTYEILLVRVFAIEHFHHFAFMVIGVAMLGFGASGTLLAITPRRGPEASARWFARAAALTPLALILCPALAQRIPLDPTQIVWDPSQWPRLAIVYGVLALPFLAGSLAMLLALELEPERPGSIYGASFVGSGIGAALAVVVLGLTSPGRALALPALVAALGVVCALRPGAGVGRAAAYVWVLLGVAIVALLDPPWTVRASPYKALTQVEAQPGARRVAERSSPLGWVVAVDAPAFRYAPGLSLAFHGTLPRQRALFVDGEIAGAAMAWRDLDTQDERSRVAFLDWLPSSLPYALGGRDRVLILGAGGGTEAWNAAAHGARMATAVELQKDLVSLGRGPEPARSSAPGFELEWVVGDARSHVARTRERYDLVTLGPGGAFGASAAGVHALSEDFLNTVEAYARYLELLTDGGVLAVTEWLSAPPREGVRLILTAGEALRRREAAAARSGLVVAHSWGTVTVLARPSGFTPGDVEHLLSWARVRGFDLDWYPGVRGSSPGMNVLDDPVLFRAAEAASSGSAAAARFASTYPFDVSPAFDARPYPHHFLRVRSVSGLLGSSRGSWLPFAEWGTVAILVTLAQSALLATLFLAAPAALAGRRRGASGGGLSLIAYFSAIGLAYMAAELAAIQQLGLLLGHPVYAVAAALAAMLVCSGFGSVWSDRWRAGHGWVVAGGLALALGLCSVLLLGLVHGLQAASLVVRVTAGLAMLAPLAFLMGMPFPIGLRSLVRDPGADRAWAWAANGFASVVAAPLAALIALEWGSAALFAVGGAAYAAAATVHRLARRAAPIETTRGAAPPGIRSPEGARA